MSMAEYMYKLLYGRKLGRSQVKNRQHVYLNNNPSSSSSCYAAAAAADEDFMESSNRTYGYVQIPYAAGGSGCHDVCPSWIGNIVDSTVAMDSGKSSYAPASLCHNSWRNSSLGDHDPGGHGLDRCCDPAGFYPVPGAGGFPTAYLSAEAGKASAGNRKNCRFNSVACDSLENADDPPKFSQTLQFQISQHLWENLSLGVPTEDNVISAHGVSTSSAASHSDYTQSLEPYAGNVSNGPHGGGPSYPAPSSCCSSSSIFPSASSSSTSMSFLPTPCPDVSFSYSPPCRASTMSLGFVPEEFPSPEAMYKAPEVVTERPATEELPTTAASGYQEWRAGFQADNHEQYCCCPADVNSIGLYACSFLSGQKISADGFYHGLETGQHRVGSADAFSFKPEAKCGVGDRWIGCQMTSPADDDDDDDVTSGRINNFSVGKLQTRSPYFPAVVTPTSASSAQARSSQLQQQSPQAMAHTSKALLLRQEVKPREATQMCAVCGDNAACQHYGVRTCEGCKGFFKRTVQKGSKYVCLSGKNCPIDKRRRNRCQFCRFQKCLTVGMVKEVVRTDTLKGRRGRLPSKVKNPGAVVGCSPGAPHLSPGTPITIISGLLKAHIDTTPDALVGLDYSLYRVPSVDEEELDQPTPEAVQQFYGILVETADVVRRWADRIPGFCHLPKEDQELIINTSIFELIVLKTAIGVDLVEESITFSNGLVLHKDQCRPTLGPWVDRIVDFGRSIKSMETDLPTIASIMALVLLQYGGSGTGLKEPGSTESLYCSIKNALHEHCNRQGSHQQLQTMLDKVSDLRTVCQEGVARLVMLKSIVEPPKPVRNLFQLDFNS